MLTFGFAEESFKNVACKNIPFRADGKFDIPDYIKHVKLDVGLSYSAPMSQYWLSRESDLAVFGFEPNPAAVNSILAGATRQHPTHGDPLEKRFIGDRFFLVACALGESVAPTIKFFITKNDCGCSSVYTPKYFPIDRIIEVPIYPLTDFFELFPFDTHPVIDYIKIDAQGSDLSIVKSAGHYLEERVVYITIEAEDALYEDTTNSVQAIDDYMKSIGFVRHFSPYTSDPTYFNPRYSDYIKKNDVKIYQKG